MALSAIKTAIESGNVVVVSKGYCPYCKRAKVSVFKLNHLTGDFFEEWNEITHQTYIRKFEEQTV